MTMFPQDQNLIYEIDVLMGCFLEHSLYVHFVLVTFATQKASINAMAIYRHGASVHTPPLSLNVLMGSGKSLKRQGMSIYSSGISHKRQRNQQEYCLHLHPAHHLPAKLLTSLVSHQKVKV
nr:hypothetical protein Iba_chr07aCG1000 [Ipomoea batatas]GMD15517.1 hypothetical protein Iba_chr07cCG0520 [Ipomoea batatas]GMD17185.1 hypothetical protein Iba_chr07dCG1140 [Ipomoea batatas]GMD18646.1 hypothetical protein Iba_chr07eCG1180 [Ipomoea batatas]GMD20086.1 hypothetical protein Iba_chr07fCG1470 [Ipomoea batatas]